MDLRSVINSLPVDSDVLCGSINAMFDKPCSSEHEHGTSEPVETDHDTSFGGYCEVQLATALHWDVRQKKMILLEQLLAKGDIGWYHVLFLLLKLGILAVLCLKLSCIVSLVGLIQMC